MPLSLATAALGPPSVQISNRARSHLDQSLESGWNRGDCVASSPWSILRAHRQSHLPAQEALLHPDESEAELVNPAPGASAQFGRLEIHEGAPDTFLTSRPPAALFSLLTDGLCVTRIELPELDKNDTARL